MHCAARLTTLDRTEAVDESRRGYQCGKGNRRSTGWQGADAARGAGRRWKPRPAHRLMDQMMTIGGNGHAYAAAAQVHRLNPMTARPTAFQSSAPNAWGAGGLSDEARSYLGRIRERGWLDAVRSAFDRADELK